MTVTTTTCPRCLGSGIVCSKCRRMIRDYRDECPACGWESIAMCTKCTGHGKLYPLEKETR